MVHIHILGEKFSLRLDHEDPDLEEALTLLQQQVAETHDRLGDDASKANPLRVAILSGLLLALRVQNLQKTVDQDSEQLSIPFKGLSLEQKLSALIQKISSVLP